MRERTRAIDSQDAYDVSTGYCRDQDTMVHRLNDLIHKHHTYGINKFDFLGVPVYG